MLMPEFVIDRMLVRFVTVKPVMVRIPFNVVAIEIPFEGAHLRGVHRKLKFLRRVRELLLCL